MSGRRRGSEVSAKGSAAGQGTSKKRGGRKLLLAGLLAVVALVGAASLFAKLGLIPGFGVSSHDAGMKPGSVVAAGKPVDAPPVFLDLPDIVANLNAGARRASYLKLHVKLELGGPSDQPIAVAAMPRLLDLFQTYLRDVRPDELRGSEGTYRLREELIARANLAIAPAQVANVLFTEILVQ